MQCALLGTFTKLTQYTKYMNENHNEANFKLQT